MNIMLNVFYSVQLFHIKTSIKQTNRFKRPSLIQTFVYFFLLFAWLPNSACFGFPFLVGDSRSLRIFTVSHLRCCQTSERSPNPRASHFFLNILVQKSQIALQIRPNCSCHRKLSTKVAGSPFGGFCGRHFFRWR
jgi:hypothetical protein